MSEVLEDLIVHQGSSLEAFFMFVDESLEVITPNTEWPSIECVIRVGDVTLTKTLANTSSLDVVSDPNARLRLRLTTSETAAFPPRAGGLYLKLTDATSFVHYWPSDPTLPKQHLPFRVFEPGA